MIILYISTEEPEWRKHFGNKSVSSLIYFITIQYYSERTFAFYNIFIYMDVILFFVTSIFMPQDQVIREYCFCSAFTFSRTFKLYERRDFILLIDMHTLSLLTIPFEIKPN